MPFSYDALDPEIKALVGERITALSAETLAGVQAVIARGFREQIPAHKLARLLRQTVGLDARSAQAVMTFEQNLLASGTPPSIARGMVRKYSTRKVAERALAIARTETVSLLNKGQRSALRQAVSANVLPENSERIWILTDDERLCPVCAELEGEQVPVNEDFSVGDPPAHPNCRCTFGFAAAEEPIPAV